MNQFRILGASPDESKERVKRISNGYPIEQIDQSHAGLERSELHPVSDEHEGGREVLWPGEFPLLKSSREAEQTNFNDYQLLRINEIPVIESPHDAQRASAYRRR